MSSIHEALKKAERDRFTSLPPVIQQLNNSKRRPWLRWAVTIVVVIDLAIAAWFFWPVFSPALSFKKPVASSQQEQVTPRAEAATVQEPAAPPEPPKVYSRTQRPQPVAAFEPVMKKTTPAKPVPQPSPKPSPQHEAKPVVENKSGPSQNLQNWADQQTVQALIVKQSKPEKSFAIVSGTKVKLGYRFANGAMVTAIRAEGIEVRDANGTAIIRAE